MVKNKSFITKLILVALISSTASQSQAFFLTRFIGKTIETGAKVAFITTCLFGLGCLIDRFRFDGYYTNLAGEKIRKKIEEIKKKRDLEKNKKKDNLESNNTDLPNSGEETPESPMPNTPNTKDGSQRESGSQASELKRCSGCTENKNQEAFCTLSCGHECCKGCLMTMILSAAESKSSQNLVCPECKQSLGDVDVRAVTREVMGDDNIALVNAIIRIKDEEFIAGGETSNSSNSSMPNTENRSQRESNPQASELKRCSGCAQNRNEEAFCTLSCGHECCKECLMEKICSTIETKSSQDLVCPECQRQLEIADVRVATNDDVGLVNAITRIKDEEFIAGMQQEQPEVDSFNDDDFGSVSGEDDNQSDDISGSQEEPGNQDAGSQARPSSNQFENIDEQLDQDQPGANGQSAGASNVTKDGLVISQNEKECEICADDSCVFHKLSCCSHEACSDCISRQMDIAVNEKTTRNLKCPGCNELIKSKDLNVIAVRIWGDREKIKQLNEIKLSEMHLHDDQLKCCPGPDCGKIIPIESTSGTRACPYCNHEFCGKCLKTHSNVTTCEEHVRLSQHPENQTEEEQANQEYMRREGIKACPGCGVLIKKSEGCNHMTCKIEDEYGGRVAGCGQQFCYACDYVHPRSGEAYTGSVHDLYRCAGAQAQPGYQDPQQIDRDAEYARQLQQEERFGGYY